MKEFLVAKKGLLAAIGGGIVAVAVAVVLIINLNKKEESYRVITVHEVEGTTVIKSANADPINAFKGKNLQNGDDATVSADSSITLLLDSDKYIYAESNAHFWLDATGSAGSTKTVIHADSGDTIHHLENKLGSDEVYNVSTPASTMAVRGTVFRVVVYQENGISYTQIEVFQGAVTVELNTTEGNPVGVSRTINAGECALMRASTDFSEFVGVNGASADENAPIDYHNIPQSVAQNLGIIIDTGEELSIGKELLFDFVEITPHEFETNVTKEATCTEDGEQEEICTICGLSNGVETIPATGHTIVSEVLEGEKCTDGIITKETCSVCNEVINESKEVSTHSYGAWKVTKAATCTATGEEERACTLCEDKQTRTIVVKAHSFGNYVTVANASCTAAGSEKRTCTGCGLEETREIAATGHSYGNYVTVVEAGCTTTGTEVSTCSQCNDKQTRTVAAKGHSYGNYVTVAEASCTATGSKRGTCSGCGATTTETIPANGHSYVESDTWDASCSESGGASYECSVCGDSYTQETPALGHTWGEWERNYDVECTAENSERRVCSVCEDEENRVAGHSYRHGHGEYSYDFVYGEMCEYCSMWKDESALTVIPTDETGSGSCPVCNREMPYWG